MAKLLQAAQSRVDQRFTAHLGSRTVEFRYMPLGCHLFSFFADYTEARPNGRVYYGWSSTKAPIRSAT